MKTANLPRAYARTDTGLDPLEIPHGYPARPQTFVDEAGDGWHHVGEALGRWVYERLRPRKAKPSQVAATAPVPEPFTPPTPDADATPVREPDVAPTTVAAPSDAG